MMTGKSTFWADQSTEMTQVDIDRMIEKYPYMSHLHIMKALQKQADVEMAARATTYCPSRQWWKTSSADESIVPSKPSAQIIPIRREQKQIVALAEDIEQHRSSREVLAADRPVSDLYQSDHGAGLAPVELIYQADDTYVAEDVVQHIEKKQAEEVIEFKEKREVIRPYTTIRPEAKTSILPEEDESSVLLSFLKGLKAPERREQSFTGDAVEEVIEPEVIKESVLEDSEVEKADETSAFALSAQITGKATPRVEKKKKSKKAKKKKKLKLKKMPVSETLANLLWVQGHRKKALKMYKKLYRSALNNSEKKTYFAARIKKLKKIKRKR